MSVETSEQTKRDGFLSLPILRDIVLVVLIVIFGWKMLNAELKIDMASFGFTDLLALILALFSVALSVAFYFKATDASSKFYDNTYKFTKETSEMLGRIEAGFGEKLRHIDEGYNGIRDRFDRMPPYPKVTDEDVKKEEDDVLQKEKAQKAVIENLAKKANLAEDEKTKLFQTLDQMKQELDQARMELHRMRTSSHLSSEDTPDKQTIWRYLASKITGTRPSEDWTFSSLSSKRVKDAFAEILPALHPDAVRDMKKLDLLDDRDTLTREGMTGLGVALRRN